MRRFVLILASAALLAMPAAFAQSSSDSGPYKVITRAKVGGEGGWDYIYADAAGRRLYIPRGASQQGAHARLTIFNLDTLEPVGEIDAAGGHGTAVDPKSGHGFVSGKPVSMFDTKTMKMIKTIDPGQASPDGILFDAYNERVYVFSHPTKDATVIDAKDGSVVGTNYDVDGLVPEERRLLQDASVLGKTFTREALAGLAGLDQPDLEPLLSS